MLQWVLSEDVKLQNENAFLGVARGWQADGGEYMEGGDEMKKTGLRYVRLGLEEEGTSLQELNQLTLFRLSWYVCVRACVYVCLSEREREKERESEREK